MNFQKDPNRLEVYSEIRKSKIFVGTLSYNEKSKQFIFDYDRKYLLSKSAIPLGPELPLKKQHHSSKRGELFPSLHDRIPSRENAAFEEYCLSQGISPSEKNPIILLTTIGRRGPSTFVFEPVYLIQNIVDDLRAFRKLHQLTLREISSAFDIHLPTLSKIETGKSKDKNTLKLLTIYLSFPSVALWQIRTNERKLHKNTLMKLVPYFENEMQLPDAERRKKLEAALKKVE